jgi:integrase
VAAHTRDGTKVPRVVTSCELCLAWGLMFAQGLCLDCYNFTTPSRGHHPGTCGACRRHQPLKKGYCRLCWCQARDIDRTHAADTRGRQVVAPHLPGVRHHQLFFAGMHGKHTPKPPSIARRRGARGRPPKAAPQPVTAPRLVWVQPALFDDDAVIRVHRGTPVDLRRETAPDNPWLAWALYLAHSLAEARGWAPVVRRTMQRTLVMLLADHQSGDRLRVSRLREAVKNHSVNLDHLIEILAVMDVVDDDRSAPLEPWFACRLLEAAVAIRRDTLTWARLLRDGAPRSRPRDLATVRIYLTAVETPLGLWSKRYDHLREVTRDDVASYLATLTGHSRQAATVALRSLFRWAKRTNLVFRNPTARIRLPHKAIKLFTPLHPGEIEASVRAATSPQAKLYVALAIVHAARSGQIRVLRLDDVDLGGRRITIAGNERPLDDLTYRLVRRWLNLRRERWPNTANPHLLVNRATALAHKPVSHTWILNLRGLPGTVERLRIDRQLDEAMATGGDPLHLAAVFGIGEKAAVRWALNARTLLQQIHDTPPDPG